MTRAAICPVDIACNDPDNGLFDHRASAIQLDDQILELAAHDMRGPRMRVSGDAIFISNRKFPIVDHKSWVGNWCWDRFWLPLDDAVALFAWLHRRGMFAVEQGDTRLFNAWKSDASFPVDVLRAIISRRIAR